MTVLGIDPGYALVGYGAVQYDNNHFRVLEYGVISTQAGTPFPRRLEEIYLGLRALLLKFRPDGFAMEKLFFNTNTKTAIDVAQARGVLTLAAQLEGLAVGEYTPLQVKQSVCGYGRAEKKQVQEMTRLLLNLPSIPRPDDAADALAVAICHCHTSGSLMNAAGR
ncbi:MAG: crossover junction endodeoxyribonuclease RuvC [Oscillospiraceae bacterium]|jgi:crossover junction endodeoxyribonuclease RuvC|nr:crossover junction endodeoxyribonuclease RuvC [Oscillospiraceae bacterium]